MVRVRGVDVAAGDLMTGGVRQGCGGKDLLCRMASGLWEILGIVRE